MTSQLPGGRSLSSWWHHLLFFPVWRFGVIAGSSLPHPPMPILRTLSSSLFILGANAYSRPPTCVRRVVCSRYITCSPDPGFGVAWALCRWDIGVSRSLLWSDLCCSFLSQWICPFHFLSHRNPAVFLFLVSLSLLSYLSYWWEFREERGRKCLFALTWSLAPLFSNYGVRIILILKFYDRNFHTCSN